MFTENKLVTRLQQVFSTCYSTMQTHQDICINEINLQTCMVVGRFITIFKLKVACWPYLLRFTILSNVNMLCSNYLCIDLT